jgi:hypothetical protein
VSVSFRFLHQNPLYASPLPIPAPCFAHLILLDFFSRKILGEVYRSVNIGWGVQISQYWVRCTDQSILGEVYRSVNIGWGVQIGQYWVRCTDQSILGEVYRSVNIGW